MIPWVFRIRHIQRNLSKPHELNPLLYYFKQFKGHTVEVIIEVTCNIWMRRILSCVLAIDTKCTNKQPTLCLITAMWDLLWMKTKTISPLRTFLRRWDRALSLSRFGTHGWKGKRKIPSRFGWVESDGWLARWMGRWESALCGGAKSRTLFKTVRWRAPPFDEPSLAKPVRIDSVGAGGNVASCVQRHSECKEIRLGRSLPNYGGVKIACISTLIVHRTGRWVSESCSSVWIACMDSF